MLLTISFFVMFAIHKAEAQYIESFGRIIVGLLWICAGLILATGIYTIITGRHPMKLFIQYLFAP